MFIPDSALETKCANAECVGLSIGIRINPAEAKRMRPKAKFAISISDFGFMVLIYYCKNINYCRFNVKKAVRLSGQPFRYLTDSLISTDCGVAGTFRISGGIYQRGPRYQPA
jgi:hypothetical protein